MGAPNVLWSEAQSLTALRDALLLVVSPPNGPVAPVDVYRQRPAATSAARGLAVWMVPTTATPVCESPLGEEWASKQRQRIRVVVLAPVQPVTAFVVLGQVASYPTQLGDGPAEVAAGLAAAVVLLGLPVAVSVVQQDGSPAVEVLADVAGVSLNVQPLAGNITKVTVDDNVRNAVYNWASWTVRIVCQDVSDSAGNNRASALAEKVRYSFQANSLPLTNGLAYKYLRDVLAEGNMAVEQVLPASLPPLDVVDDGVWVRRAAVDVVFRPVTGMTHDVPSLDVIGLAPTTPTLLDPAP